MPKFSNYNGIRPRCLKPWDLHHCLLLSYWVYFRPTALSCYLYKADSELYRLDGGLLLFLEILKVPAYRNLYLCIPIISIVITTIFGLPLLLLATQEPVTLSVTTVGAILGETIGKILLVSTICALIGTVFGIMLGSVAGMISGGALGTTFGVTVSITSSSILCIIMAMLPFFQQLDQQPYWMIWIVFGVIGMMFGVSLSAIFGTLGVPLGIMFGVIFGVQNALVVIFLRDPEIAIILGIACIAGALRLPFYLFQFTIRLFRSSREKKHIIEWDELLALPLPGVKKFLLQQLQEDELDGLRSVSTLVGNPFQRWAVQQALVAHLHNQTQPLHFLYTLLTHPVLDVYIFPPITEHNWRYLPTPRQLLLGEIGGKWVDCTSDWINRLADYLVYLLTFKQRSSRTTPLTEFSRMLSELLEEQRIDAQGFDLTSYRHICLGVSDYPHGYEVVHSFDVMASCLTCKVLSNLPILLTTKLDDISSQTVLRPTVNKALNRLHEVGAEVTAYSNATSRVNKLAAIARATDALHRLDGYVSAEVFPPEQTILKRIIWLWRKLVGEAGGEVGRADEVGPIANPYVAGSPVVGDLFVGREDVFLRLEELWSHSGQCPSVILYGHRRMGKSSILKNLNHRFGRQTAIVDFNMQLVGQVSSTGELLHNLSLALLDSLAPHPQADGPQADVTQFLAHSPYTHFKRWLSQLDQHRNGQRFIVTIDEFELLEEMMHKGQVDSYLLDYLRGLIQTYPWLILAFAGLHTLQEMTEDYWNPLFGSVTAIPVSFLRPKAAERLLTQPSPDFNIDYDADALQRIINLTHGQPYLTQLIGHTLVTRFNRQTYEEGIERERRFTLNDVEAVITSPEFYRDGNAYFTGVWSQAQTSQPAGQTDLLTVLAQGERTLSTLVAHTNLDTTQTQAVLQVLQDHDVITETDGTYRYTVELMRRWVAQYSPQS